MWLLIFLLSLLLLTAGGRLAPQDEETTFRMTANLIEFGRTAITEQSFTVEPQTYRGFLPHTQPRTLLTTWAVPGRDGRLYPQFMSGQAIVNIPLYLLGRLLSGEALNLRSILLTHWTTSLFNAIVIALTGWLVAMFASRLGYSSRLSVGLGLAYALGTMVLPYTGTYFSEPLIALLILLAAYAVYAARANLRSLLWLVVAGTALGLAVFTRERSAIMVPPFILYVWLCHRRVLWRGWVAFFAPLVIFGVIIGLFNWSRYGSPLTFGFSALQHTSFTTPLLLGLYGLLISPGKGLLLYNPIVWAGLIGLAIMFRTRRKEAILFALIMLGRAVVLCRLRILDRRVELGAALHHARTAAAGVGGRRMGLRESDAPAQSDPDRVVRHRIRAESLRRAGRSFSLSGGFWRTRSAALSRSFDPEPGRFPADTTMARGV